jgi:hypothetical protein
VINNDCGCCRLRDDARKDKKVVSYLEAENQYTSAVLKDTEGLQELLYKEMRGRIQEADQSVATRWDGGSIIGAGCISREQQGSREIGTLSYGKEGGV